VVPKRIYKKGAKKGETLIYEELIGWSKVVFHIKMYSDTVVNII